MKLFQKIKNKNSKNWLKLMINQIQKIKYQFNKIQNKIKNKTKNKIKNKIKKIK